MSLRAFVRGRRSRWLVLLSRPAAGMLGVAGRASTAQPQRRPAPARPPRRTAGRRADA